MCLRIPSQCCAPLSSCPYSSFTELTLQLHIYWLFAKDVPHYIYPHLRAGLGLPTGAPTAAVAMTFITQCPVFSLSSCHARP